jgi:hypothetical protein
MQGSIAEFIGNRRQMRNPAAKKPEHFFNFRNGFPSVRC